MLLALVREEGGVAGRVLSDLGRRAAAGKRTAGRIIPY